MPNESMWWNPRTKVWNLRTKEDEKKRQEASDRIKAIDWETEQRSIADAKVLAEFANLQPRGVRQFRAVNSGFFPEAWWEYRPTAYDGSPSPKEQWQIAQKFLRDAWLFEFETPLFDYIHLFTSVFDPDDSAAVPLRKKYRPPFATGIDLGDDYPYHRAIRWLTGQGGWRAKTCLFCEKRFIAEHPNGRFCSVGVTVDGIKTICSWAYRKGYKNAWWAAHNDRVNEKRRKEYEQQKRRESSTRRTIKPR